MSITTSFFTPVQDDIREVEALIRAQAEGYHPDLGAALNHLLSSGGKRVRPIVTLLVGRMLGGDRQRMLVLAASIELLHTATLVHDDLIDGSLLRRGISTLNSQWSPGATVLTGDFLFSRAARLAADTESVPVIKVFAQTLTEIVNGEITQLFHSRCKISRSDYYQRIYAKTASLFQTSSLSAALLCQVDESLVEIMRRYGHDIGMAFQIMDDILDFTSNPDVLGKPVGSDLRQGLITLPTLYYAESHPDDPEIEAMKSGNCIDNNARIDRLVNAIRSSNAVQMAFTEAKQYVQSALDALAELPDCEEKRRLEELAVYIVERDL